jgi:predicted O-linked N-acetylglucosamine transferase (SPINDLY family)
MDTTEAQVLELAAIKLLDDQPEEALTLYRELSCPHPGLQLNIALCHQMQKDYESAIEIYERLRARYPDYVRAYLGLANCHRYMGNTTEAVLVLELARTANPEYPQTYYLLSAMYMMANEVELAVKMCLNGLLTSAEMAARDTSNFAQCYYENFNESVYTMRQGAATLLDFLYTEYLDSKALLALHTAFDIATPDVVLPTPENRTLKIGFMSENFRHNATTGFVWPLLEPFHDAETYFYQLGSCDDVTFKMQEEAHVFKICCDMELPELVNSVRNDQLDVLISLDGHTGTCATLTVMADRLAPVQMDYLGYPCTVCRKSIDYKIVDDQTDPLDTEEEYAEQLLRMPAPFLCWVPILPSGRPARHPIRTHQVGKRILAPHNFKKISHKTVQLMTRVLTADEECQIFFKSSLHANPGDVQMFFDRHFKPFTKRIKILEYVEDMQENLDRMSSYDLVLDTFPYSGTTTTVECLFCGLPVVTLCGDSHRSRVSSSLLEAIGHSELIARTEDEYVDIAVELLSQPAQLMKLQYDVQQDLCKSPLMDVDDFRERFFKSVHCASRLSSSVAL